jgi:hypothetical protein
MLVFLRDQRPARVPEEECAVACARVLYAFSVDSRVKRSSAQAWVCLEAPVASIV